MKKIFLSLLLTAPIFLFAQLGIKAGINFANIRGASDINSSNRSGFHAGILFGGSSKKVLGSRTELLFSQQGYNYKTGANTGNVNLDYLSLHELLAINITKYFQLQLGTQIAYLLNAKKDSSSNPMSSLYDSLGLGGYGKILNTFNRIDYGLAGGFEIHPVKGLLIGARIIFSFSNLYKMPDANDTQQQTSYSPSFSGKNNVIQAYIGWQFGKK
ncbi:MAG: porin family protein [Chitinophagaceae bacterium]